MHHSASPLSTSASDIYSLLIHESSSPIPATRGGRNRLIKGSTASRYAQKVLPMIAGSVGTLTGLIMSYYVSETRHKRRFRGYQTSFGVLCYCYRRSRSCCSEIAGAFATNSTRRLTIGRRSSTPSSSSSTTFHRGSATSPFTTSSRGIM